ncbi:hypothetical protein V8E54_013199 [Elaphomyces granulatus]
MDDLDLNHRDPGFGWTAPRLACNCQNIGLLLNCKRNPNIKDRVHGATPLAYACCIANLDLVHLLLTHPDIDPNPAGAINLEKNGIYDAKMLAS